MDWNIFFIGLGLLIFFAQGGWKNMSKWMKWPGIIAGILLMILSGVGEMSPSLKIPKGPAILFIIGVVAIISSVVWYIDIKKSLKAVEYWFRANIDDYPPNTIIGGINWNPSYTDVRIGLNNPTNRDYTDLEIIITTDMMIAQIGQITKLPNIAFVPMGLPPGDLSIEIKDGITGKTKVSIPLTGVSSNTQIFSSQYRVLCPVLPRHSHIDIILAAVTIDHSPMTKTLSMVYKEKRLPIWVQISGHYQDLGREYPFEKKHSFEGQSN